MSKSSGIAAVLGLSVSVVIAMITGGIDKIQKELRYMQKDDFYILNWRVDYYSSYLFSQPQNQIIYYYAPFALLFDNKNWRIKNEKN